MVEHLLGAGFYATVTILIDERSEGTPISRHDGKRSRFLQKFYGFEHGKQSG
jgi:hypothetical protein